MGSTFAHYIKNKHNPHQLLQTLKRVAKPSNETLQRAIEAELNRLNMGPKRLGLDNWLVLYIKISQMAKRIDAPPIQASTKHLIRHLIISSEKINPLFYNAFARHALQERPTLTLEEMIEKFNLSYIPSTGQQAAFPTLTGESIDTRKHIAKSTSPTTSSSTGQQRECKACGGKHNVTKCRNLFEELRPEDWVVNERQERRCQEYLKTSEGRTLYKKQKQHFAEHPPERPILQPTITKRKASSDPEPL